MEGFQGFARPRVDRHNGTKKYAPGDYIDIASTETNEFICDFIFNTGASIMAVDYDVGADTIYFTYYLTATTFSVYKYVRNTTGLSPLYEQSVRVDLSNGGSSSMNASTIMEYNQYLFVTCGNTIYKLNKSNLSTVISVNFSDYSIIAMRMSKDETYLFGISRPSSGNVSVFKYTLALGFVSSIDTGVGYNYVFCGIDNRHVTGGYDVNTGFMVDTVSMTKFTGSQYYLSCVNGAFVPFFHQRSFWSGGYLFIFSYSIGAVYKCSVVYNGDGSLASITLIASLIFWGTTWTNFFDYDDNYIYASRSTITNFTTYPVLISKNTLLVEKYSKLQITQQVEDQNYSKNIFIKKMQGFFCEEYLSYNGQSGYSNKYFLIKRKTKILN